MAASAERFGEVLAQETRVEIDSLRDIAFYGVPAELRGEVWAQLLPALVAGTPLPAGSEDAPLGVDEHDGLTDSEILRVLKTELSRFKLRSAASFKNAKTQTKMLNILYRYLHRGSNAWRAAHGALVHVVAPFASIYKRESQAAAMFELMMRALDSHYNSSTGGQVLGRFLMLFRSRLPELFTHFEEENVEPTRWASPWLRWLLCRELPFDCVLRLWDAYFAAPYQDGFELHTFVCLAILDNCQSDLIELEHAELLTFLQHLPSLDMDRIVVQAQYLSRDFRFH